MMIKSAREMEEYPVSSVEMNGVFCITTDLYSTTNYMYWVDVCGG